jgi:hypothetical protein
MTSTETLEARKTNEHISFAQWLAALDHAALTAGFKGRIAADTGAECWQEYYDDGYTPTAALSEDLGHAR